MLRHNLVIFYRTFLNNKMSFFINLLGLSSGLTCVILISLWVNDELQVDQFHENNERLYQVMRSVPLEMEGISTSEITPTLLGETAANEIPEIDFAVTTTPNEVRTFTHEDKGFSVAGKWAGENFFRAFSYTLIHGDENQVLQNKESVVISRDLATKLFGDADNVIGKAVEIKDWGDFVISGVFENTPKNSSDQFEYVLPLIYLIDRFPGFSDWGNNYPRTFFVLNNTSNIELLNSKITTLIRSKSISQEEAVLTTIPYSDKYLRGSFDNGIQTGGRITYVRLFAVIALLILIIACINFMNLSTAKAMRRMKEVGIKKTVGSGRKSLIFQHFFEAVLMTTVSAIVAIILTLLVLPIFNEISDKALDLNWSLAIVGYMLLIILVTGIIAGSYPALYLSSFDPEEVLKGNVKGSIGELLARKGLVIFQYIVSIVLIVSVFVIYKQLDFIQNKNLGYSKDGLVYYPAQGNITKHLETYLSEVKKIPGVIDASSMDNNFFFYPRTNELEWEGKSPDRKIDFNQLAVNTGFIEMLDIEMKEGRAFSKDFATDDTKIIFNETAIEMMNLNNPIGKSVQLYGQNRSIIGVVKNFHFESLHQNIGPLLFIPTAENSANSIMVKIDVNNQNKVLESLGQHFKSFNPGFSFDFKFVDDEYQSKYSAEQRVSKLSRFFAILAIIISCLGLYGLAAFTTERRRMEIGIRKTMGSSNSNIFYLLSLDFIKILLVAILIALPISYLIARRWLEGYSYRIELQIWYFLAAGLVSLIIAILTIGLQIVKVANIDPVDCLREE